MQVPCEGRVDLYPPARHDAGLTREGEKVAKLALAAVEAADEAYFRPVEDAPRLIGALRAMAGRPTVTT